MQTAVETINGHLCTVIRQDFDAKKVRETLAIGVPVMVETQTHGTVTLWDCWGDELRTPYKPIADADIINTITILPALPSYIKTIEQQRLVNRYISEGIIPIQITSDGRWYGGEVFCPNVEIAHAIDTNKNNIDVAIE